MPAVTISRGQMLAFKADVAAFNRDLTKMQSVYEGQAADFLKEVALDFIARVIEYTPVDTGRAASAWWPAADSLGAGVLAEQRANDGPGKDEGEQQLGRSEGRYAEQLDGRRKWILIANGVPYIMALEFGTSNQGGHAMVRRALAEIRSGLREAWRRFHGGRA